MSWLPAILPTPCSFRTHILDLQPVVSAFLSGHLSTQWPNCGSISYDSVSVCVLCLSMPGWPLGCPLSGSVFVCLMTVLSACLCLLLPLSLVWTVCLLVPSCEGRGDHPAVQLRHLDTDPAAKTSARAPKLPSAGVGGHHL